MTSPGTMACLRKIEHLLKCFPKQTRNKRVKYAPRGLEEPLCVLMLRMNK